MTRGRIVGTGSKVPDKVVTNSDLEGMMETTDAWITARTGIKERRVTVKDTTDDLASGAASAALKNAGISPKDIDLVIVGTCTPEMTFPSTACLVQARLGIKKGIPCFDVSAACSGFLYALDIADKYMRSGEVKHALVIGADIFSRIVDWQDRSTCILFGDGAGAVVLTATQGKRGVLSSHAQSDGNYWETLYAPGTISTSPFEKKHGIKPSFVKMKGNETFKIAVRTMLKASKEVLAHNNLTPGDVDLFIPHQANMRIINAIKEKFKLSDDKVYVNIDRFGNTSAASIPIALDEANRGGLIKANNILLLVAFGGGFTWASAAVKW